MISVTKKFSFCYGHFLPDYEGKCANQHGHNAELEVEVMEGSVLKDHISSNTNMILDFSLFKEIVDKKVIQILDHKNLNDTPFPYPTVENIVLWIRDALEHSFPPSILLIRVRVTETPTSWAEWRLCA